MEITTIVGIVFAVIIMMIGLFWMFKKPNDAAPSLDSALHFNEESQKPIIPRHVRNQLQAVELSTERVEPILDKKVHSSETGGEKSEPILTTGEDDLQKELNLVNEDKIQTEVRAKNTQNKLDENLTHSTSQSLEDSLMGDAKSSHDIEEDVKAESQGFSLNNHIHKAEIAEFDEESSILDAHLYEQNVVDDECALVTAESFIAFNIISKNRILSGEKTLKVLLKYGLRFGEMKCFHRYNDDGSKLLFSVLKLTDEGTEGFDLETLSTEEVKGLACFLALPHHDVQNAFDTMVSISGLIAREISGLVYDQDNFELTPQLREYWRHQAIDYKSGTLAKA